MEVCDIGPGLQRRYVGALLDAPPIPFPRYELVRVGKIVSDCCRASDRQPLVATPQDAVEHNIACWKHRHERPPCVTGRTSAREWNKCYPHLPAAEGYSCGQCRSVRYFTDRGTFWPTGAKPGEASTGAHLPRHRTLGRGL